MLAMAGLVVAWAGSPWVSLLAPVAGLGALERWRRCGSLSHPRAIVRLTVRGPQLSATLADGSERNVQPLSDSRLSGGYLFLALREASGGQRLLAILIPRSHGGNTPPDALRRLRTWLRLMPEAATPMEGTTTKPIPLKSPWPGGNP